MLVTLKQLEPLNENFPEIAEDLAPLNNINVMSKNFRYLLDTNIISDLVKHPSGKVMQTIAKVGEKSVCTSIVVAAELRFGAEKRGSTKLVHQLEKFGKPIGPNDMLIAAQALALNLIVVTANTNEFSRVPGLATDNWLT